MTLSYRIPGASFTKTLIRAKPVILESAELYLLLGGDPASSILDRNGKASASVVGTPVYGNGFCTLNASNGFQAAAAAAGQPFTFMGAFTRPATSDTVVQMGNWTGSTPRHALTTSNGNLRLTVDGAVRAQAAMPDAMQMVAASHNGTAARLYLGAKGAMAKTEAAFSGGAQTSVFRAGASGTGGTNTFNMALAVYWRAVLTDAEITAVALYLRDVLLLRGVTVL
jgi:hypothetical protein